MSIHMYGGILKLDIVAVNLCLKGVYFYGCVLPKFIEEVSK